MLVAYLCHARAQARTDYHTAYLAWAIREPHYQSLPAPDVPALLSL